MNSGQFRMLGFIDDDPTKRGMRIQGYTVLGDYRTLLSLIEDGSVDRIVISTRSIRAGQLRDIESVCAQHGVALSRLHLQLEPLVAVS